MLVVWGIGLLRISIVRLEKMLEQRFGVCSGIGCSPKFGTLSGRFWSWENAQ